MKKMLLAACLPIMPHRFGWLNRRSGDTNIEAAAGNGSVLVAQQVALSQTASSLIDQRTERNRGPMAVALEHHPRVLTLILEPASLRRSRPRTGAGNAGAVGAAGGVEPSFAAGEQTRRRASAPTRPCK
jgi:hypothetical protein